MKKLISIILIFVFVFNVAIAEDEEKFIGDVAGWKFELQDWHMSKDNKNNNVIVLRVYMENISAKWGIFKYDVSMKLFQDGLQLEDAYYVKDVDPSKLSKETRKGAKLYVDFPFVLENTVSPIDIEIYESDDYFLEKDPIKWTINLN